MRCWTFLLISLTAACVGGRDEPPRPPRDAARPADGLVIRNPHEPAENELPIRLRTRKRSGNFSVTSALPGGTAAADPPVPPDSTTALTIRVLPVRSRAGGGDAILLADSSASPPRHVLIDAGDDRTVAAALSGLGIASLDLLVLTHAHHDHYGGMDDVLEAVPVRAFAFNGQVRTAVTYRRLLQAVDRRVATVIVIDSIRRVRLGDGPDATLLTLIPPLPGHIAADTDHGERLNDGSLAVRIERAGFSFLTTGDAERDANRRFAREFAALVDVDILKVGHHGSTDATQPFWLDATTPDVAVVSANGTTHPHAPVLALLAARGIDVYCTPQHGTVTIRVGADGAYRVRTEAPATRRCLPGDRR